MGMSKETWHLRFAITGKCNFRCQYCNIHGKTQFLQDLAFKEVKEILEAVKLNGIDRVHFTGGEPFLRNDMLDIMATAKKIGFSEQVVTTNGFNLYKIIDQAIEHGLTRAIISLDTMSQKRNLEITQRDKFEDTIKSIKAATQKLETTTKISCVTMKSTLKEIPKFIEFIKKANSNPNNKGELALKLNQFHPDNEAQLYSKGQKYWADEYVDEKDIIATLGKIGKLQAVESNETEGDNPSYQYYEIGNTGVKVGILAMMSWGFPCGKCHKLRIQPSGYVKVCKNYKKSPVLAGLSLEQKTKIISEWKHYRDNILDIAKPNRIHYDSQLGEERWGKVGKPKEAKFFFDLIQKQKTAQPIT